MRRQNIFDYDHAPASTLYYQPAKKSKWKKERHLPSPIAAVIIIIFLIVCGKPIMINSIKFVAKNNIPIPEPVVQLMEQIVIAFPNEFDFIIERK